MKKTLLIAMALISSAIAFAHDFSVRLSDGQQLYFNIISLDNNLVELTYPVKIANTKPIFYGKLTVPATVKWNDKVYKVVAIGKKAFVNDVNLTEVVLPSGLVKIDDFAFEGCTNLRSIIFPGNKVTFGSGTFFRCTSIANVTLGSDWTTFDMKVFRWSEDLEEINIPAKLEKITNLKSMKHLRKITVDPNNNAFTAVDGILYNKPGTTMLCCPRNYGYRLDVPYGVMEIRWGALGGCKNLNTVILPATLAYLSYREFASLENLRKIVMKSSTPIMTAQSGTRQCFLLQVYNKSTIDLYVPKKAEKLYKRSLCTIEGNYTEITTNLPAGMDSDRAVVPYEVKDSEMLHDWSIHGEKDFSDF